VLSPAGPLQTRIRSIRRESTSSAFAERELESDALVPDRTIYMTGLGVAEPVVFGPMAWLEFQGCRFEREFTLEARDFSGPRLVDSEFLARTRIVRATTPIRGCRFRSAPLYVQSGSSNFMVLEDCTFVGPTDTAVVASSIGDAFIRFEDCEFIDVSNGILPLASGGYETFIVERCRFRDIEGAAIDWNESFTEAPFGLAVADSRFERCGRGIRWGPATNQHVALVADTLLQCSDTAIETGFSGGSLFDGVLVTEGAGDGVVVRMPQIAYTFSSAMTLRGCQIVENAGVGVRVFQIDDDVNQGTVRVEGSTFSDNEGGGLVVRGARFEGRDNLLLGNGGPGFEILMVGSTPVLRLERNTVVGSLGDGVHCALGNPAATVSTSIANNLVVLNAGTGISVATGLEGSFAFNDAWLNYAGAYGGPFGADSNLTVDPVFCDLAAGDLSISSVSPCAPSGLYGQIGALGVGCNRLADVPPAGATAGPTIQPNPARGRVSLAPPWPGGGATAEIFDLQGRRMWSGATTPGQPALEWKGSRDSGGRCSPGLYLVRFSRGAETRYARLVWLE
jgi:hypothetical protein